MKRRMIACCLLILLFLPSCQEQPTGDVTKKEATEKTKPTGDVQTPLRSGKAKSVEPAQKLSIWDIQGFRTGMEKMAVKRLLDKKGITEYETGFSDLFTYTPAFGAEMRLLFTCTAKGNVLGRIELSMAFTVDETEKALSKFKEKLISKYGVPSITDYQWDRLDYCWGQCGQESTGTKLTARTTALEGNRKALVLTLDDRSLAAACAELRPKKINGFLYQWIAAAQAFKLGMPLKDASTLYQKRYHDKMTVEEERDGASLQYAVTGYVVKDYDFFTALDFESQAFEGAGPGTIILKFTGGQAGKGRLNRRLYYASFSTTKFTDKHTYGDVKEKLDKFIKNYGTPAEVIQQADSIAARWQQDTKQRSVNISDSGLITFEEFDQALKDAYRDAAVQTIEEYSKTRFDRPLF